MYDLEMGWVLGTRVLEQSEAYNISRVSEGIWEESEIK